LKFAGYDHLLIYGASDRPVYLTITDSDVELKDAGHLWGLDVRETDTVLKEELQDNDIVVSSIGPAGENLVRFAGIMNSIYNAAGRGGAGAVMGSKRLKAIAVRGTGEIQVNDPERFNLATLAARNAVVNDSGTKTLHEYGTSRGIIFMNDFHRLSVHNFQEVHLDSADSISGQYLVEHGYLKRRVGCFACPI